MLGNTPLIASQERIKMLKEFIIGITMFGVTLLIWMGLIVYIMDLI